MLQRAPVVACWGGGGRVISKLDLWQLGCTVLEMIAGPSVYEAYDSPASAVREICGATGAPSPGLATDAVWDALRELLQLLLAVDPTDRPTVAALLELPFFSLEGSALDLLPPRRRGTLRCHAVTRAGRQCDATSRILLPGRRGTLVPSGAVAGVTVRTAFESLSTSRDVAAGAGGATRALPTTVATPAPAPAALPAPAPAPGSVSLEALPRPPAMVSASRFRSDFEGAMFVGKVRGDGERGLGPRSMLRDH